jgi:hypothetical protein
MPDGGQGDVTMTPDGSMVTDTSTDGTGHDATPVDSGGGDSAGNDAGISACGDGGILGGGLTSLASGSRPMQCVIDACNVYWTDQAIGGVMRVAKSGGAVTTMAISTPPQGQAIMSEGLAIDSTNLYWSEYVDQGFVDGGVPLRTGDVVQTPLAGGASTTIWSGSDAPNAVAVDSAYVYVLQNSDLERVPIGGGSVTTLAMGPGAYGLTVTASAVYWTPYNGIDAVYTAPLMGGSATTFATGTWSSTAMASSTVVVQDGTNLYWADTISGGTSGTVYGKPLSGGAQTSLASGQEPLGIAYDSSYLYVTTGAGGTVLKVPKAGGTVQELTAGRWPYGIAVDDTFVYWVDNNGGANSVMRIAK